QGSGNTLESAMQSFTVGRTTLVPTGAYSLNFSGADTGALGAATTAAQLQAALQNLSTIGAAGGQVTVQLANIIAGQNETQQVNSPGFNVGDFYRLYWDPNPADPPLLGFNLTSPIVYQGNPFTEKNNIVAALSGLQ